MHEIYKNARCNISASGFADGQDGFILDKRRVDPTPVPTTFEDSENSMKCCYLSHFDPWDQFEKGPLFCRAWTLQEQLLVGFLPATTKPV